MLFFISGIGWCRILQVLRAEPSRRLEFKSDNGQMGATPLASSAGLSCRDCDPSCRHREGRCHPLVLMFPGEHCCQVIRPE